MTPYRLARWAPVLLAALLLVLAVVDLSTGRWVLGVVQLVCCVLSVTQVPRAWRAVDRHERYAGVGPTSSKRGRRGESA